MITKQELNVEQLDKVNGGYEVYIKHQKNQEIIIKNLSIIGVMKKMTRNKKNHNTLLSSRI